MKKSELKKLIKQMIIEESNNSEYLTFTGLWLDEDTSKDVDDVLDSMPGLDWSRGSNAGGDYWDVAGEKSDILALIASLYGATGTEAEEVIASWADADNDEDNDEDY